MKEVEPIKGLKEREECPVEDCTGDARYFPPGKGHRADCYYPYNSPIERDAVRGAVAAQSEQVLLEAQPSEESRIIIALLMRIYDVQMALLSNVNKTEADRIYDAHAKGEDFNPQIFIPEISDEDQSTT